MSALKPARASGPAAPAGQSVEPPEPPAAAPARIVVAARALPRLVLPAVNRFFCPCPRGLEPALAAELTALGASAVSPTAGGVGCRGPIALAYRINLEARLPSRVLLLLSQGRYQGDDDLYRLALDVRWEEWFTSDQTLRVDVTAIRSPLTSLNFATLRIKDAIVDRLRERSGARPSIDTAEPDVRIAAFLHDGDAVLYADLSGAPLFKRGWRAGRETKGEAPLKENLAAGLLAVSGWSADQPLIDLFCGAGTIVIEAAQIALGYAPGLGRTFGISNLAIHDPALDTALRAAARDRFDRRSADRTGPALRIAGSDIDPAAIALARENLRAAGLAAEAVRFDTVDAADATPPWPAAGVIVSNPPYNERVPIAIEHWRAIGATLRNRYGGWRALLLTSDRGLPGQLGLRERRKTPLFNGAIECRLFEFEMRMRAAG